MCQKPQKEVYTNHLTSRNIASEDNLEDKCPVIGKYFNGSYNAILKAVKVLVAQSHPICDPMDYSPPGSSVRGILQARVLEWVAILLSRESSQPRDQTWVSSIAGRFFTI